MGFSLTMLGRVHGGVEAVEVAGADGPLAEERPKLQFDAGEETERAL